MYRSRLITIYIIIIIFAAFSVSLFAQDSIVSNPEVRTSGEGLVSRVAPGEFLPISIKLLNFGSNRRVDVLVLYEIDNEQGIQVYSSEETVAVETTASFVKKIPIPLDIPPGKYTAKSHIKYQNQLVPATSQFPFVVERKIVGLFQSDFYLYGAITFMVSIITGTIGHLWIQRRRITRLNPIDYSDIPRDRRVFYELLSDTIMEMRQRVGDSALDIAKQINGLVIDEKTGRILKITESPSKIIAELVSGYEKILGKKVSFSFRNK